MVEPRAAPHYLSSLLSAPIQPRATIRHQVGSTSVLVLLALWGSAGAANVLPTLGAASVGWQDWRALLVIVFAAVVLALATYVISAAIASFLGRLLGGVGSAGSVLEAYAWGAVPLALSLLIVPVAVGVRWQTGIQQALTVGVVLVDIASIWSLVTTVAMFTEVQKFGVFRAVVCYLLATVMTALPVALSIRMFVWQPFTIPSAAQEPTLLVGDYIFASKYSYGYSKYSFALPTIIGDDVVPLNFSGRIWPSEPKLGDVVVFRKPSDPTIDYIKRIVGLPGDEVQMQNGVLFINTKAVPKVPVEDFVERNYQGDLLRVKQFEETLPNGVKYRVLERRPDGELNNTSIFKVPSGHYFMMGDNRDNSSDSRDPNSGVGYVPFDNLVGRAELIFMSSSKDGESRAGRALTWVK